MDASLQVQPGMWRRYLAMVLDGIQSGDRYDELPGEPPGRTGIEHIPAGWVQPRRGKS